MTAFILFSSLVIPVVILVMGIVFGKRPPQDMHGSVGYRTKRSRSSKEAWDYANARSAAIFRVSGLIMTIATAIVMSVLTWGLKLSETNLENAMGIAMFIQVLVIVLPIFLIEKELKDKFG